MPGPTVAAFSPARRSPRAHPCGPRAAAAQSTARVVVVGGGFAGATAARTLRRLDPRLQVTIVERERTYTACPFSNEVIVGLRDLSAQQFTYEHLAATGATILSTSATGVDPVARTVALADGSRLPYDRLILAPGIDIVWGGLDGYTEAAAERMPHAWKAGAQTLLLRRQLEAMEDGGVVLMTAPPNPYRCPPGPYERASLIAWWLKTNRPKSKLLLLDSKDAFSKQKLFQAGWKALYPDNLEWVSLSDGGKAVRVDPANLTVETEFGTHKGAVVNVIPPQKAGAIAAMAGVADRTGWCPIHPETFESILQPNVHVIGDSAVLGAIPKSAFAANVQAKTCAAAVATLLAGGQPAVPHLINTCYSLVAPGYGISVAGVYRPAGNLFADIEGAGGTSPLDAPPGVRTEEAALAIGWYNTITADVFG